MEATVQLQLRAFRDSEDRKRRRHYRTCPPSRKCLKIHVGKDPKRWKGFIEDVTSGGTRLSFPAEDHPRYSLHESVHVQISSPYLERSLVVPSIVSYRYESVERATYGFEFTKRPADLVDIPAPLKQVFNQRRERRVRPAPDKPIHLTVTASADERFEALAHDIAAGGLSFILAADDGTLMAAGDAVELEIRLPCQAERFRARGILSSREQAAGGVHFGACFQGGKTESTAGLNAALTKYVRERRREIARDRQAPRTGTPA